MHTSHTYALSHYKHFWCEYRRMLHKHPNGKNQEKNRKWCRQPTHRTKKNPILLNRFSVRNLQLCGFLCGIINASEYYEFSLQLFLLFCQNVEYRIKVFSLSMAMVFVCVNVTNIKKNRENFMNDINSKISRPKNRTIQHIDHA